MPKGILLIDKPAGFTSFDVVAKLRGITGQKKIGHAGTLDPMATGVLVCLLGGATRLAGLFPNEDKRYTATVQFGIATDTLDITGSVLQSDELPLKAEELVRVLERFKGEISQLPPMYSAVSVGGQRLYSLARKGLEVSRPPRQVFIRHLRPVLIDEPNRKAVLDVLCSKGTYIRALADDIARALGTLGTLAALRRTAACGFSADECVALDWMQANAPGGDWQTALVPVHRVFSDLPQLEAGEWQARMLKNGVALGLDKLGNPPAGRYSLWSRGEFLGLATAGPDGGMRLKQL